MIYKSYYQTPSGQRDESCLVLKPPQAVCKSLFISCFKGKGWSIMGLTMFLN